MSAFDEHDVIAVHNHRSDANDGPFGIPPHITAP
jgi:hypothetical protein